MRFKIRHEIEYRYSKPVHLEPHTFYLKPLENRGQTFLASDLSIDPPPRLRSQIIDPFGNDASLAWFGGPTDFLRILSQHTVEVNRPNPFDFLIEPDFVALPARYSPATRSALSLYLGNPCNSDGGTVNDALSPDPAVLNFSNSAAAQVGGSVLAFLPELSRTIAGSFKKIHRAEGGPWPAARVLAEKQGACRDLTVLFMECCRVQGLAARFTSGYFDGDPDFPENELHAWAEVFVQGGGWRGFDPTAGLAVCESHVTIASAHLPEAVSPVIGTFRGDAQSTLTTRVQIKRI